jgi:5-hydroxyisourate hydrolase
MASISMHCLDTTTGRPAAGLSATLERLLPDGSGEVLGRFVTNDDGRVPRSDTPELGPGVHRVTFDTGPWLERHHGGGFWPWVPVVFQVADAGGHYHIPLLLSPYGISSYRGS